MTELKTFTAINREQYSDITLSDFSSRQETAVNKAADDARRLLELKPQFDLERWYYGLRTENPYFRGVSFTEFGQAVLGVPFSNG